MSFLMNFISFKLLFANSIIIIKLLIYSLYNICSLETTLRNFSCLTTGDSIMVAYNNKKYYIDIVKTKPSSAISIIETDCEVDFAPPLDYKEPERPQPFIPTSKASVPGSHSGYHFHFIFEAIVCCECNALEHFLHFRFVRRKDDIF